jgi:hypothetical protein
LQPENVSKNLIITSASKQQNTLEISTSVSFEISKKKNIVAFAENVEILSKPKEVKEYKEDDNISVGDRGPKSKVVL